MTRFKKSSSFAISGSHNAKHNGITFEDHQLPQQQRKHHSLPTRNKKGELEFHDHPNFKPNLTPEEVLKSGSFGGTYFRMIKSNVTGKVYKDAWKEFPESWFEGVDIPKQISSSNYDSSVNKYGVSCGTSLDMWESKGWIRAIDPFGWFQWYCRFYLGRRTEDDDRQIGRSSRVMGPTGRWRRYLINRCLESRRPLEEVVDDHTVSPKIRQILQHWGYRLTLHDLQTARGK